MSGKKKAKKQQRPVAKLKPEMVPVVIRMPESLHVALKALARDHERSMAAEVRLALRRYVESG